MFGIPRLEQARLGTVLVVLAVHAVVLNYDDYNDDDYKDDDYKDDDYNHDDYNDDDYNHDDDMDGWGHTASQHASLRGMQACSARKDVVCQ